MGIGIYKHKPFSKGTRKKISKALKEAWKNGINTGMTGRKHKSSTKLKMSKNNARAMLGRVAWNKGTKGVCKVNSASFKKGHKHSKGWKMKHKAFAKKNYIEKKLRLKLKNTGRTRFKKGHIPHNKGKSYNPGELHYNWLGGKSFEPYGVEFNNKLKEQIRQRDSYICQECNYTQEQLGYKLHIHHIDFNKKNNKPHNLISLCRSCHTKTNFNRGSWTNYFNKKINCNT